MSLHLLVNWGSSASETDQWEMNAAYAADEDCKECVFEKESLDN